MSVLHAPDEMLFHESEVEPIDLSRMSDVYAPISLFATSHVDVVEELAFRALFLVAAVVAAYGILGAV